MFLIFQYFHFSPPYYLLIFPDSKMTGYNCSSHSTGGKKVVDSHKGDSFGI